jgi:hypothetical protein
MEHTETLALMREQVRTLVNQCHELCNYSVPAPLTLSAVFDPVADRLLADAATPDPLVGKRIARQRVLSACRSSNH